MMKKIIKWLNWEILLAWIVFLLFVERLLRMAYGHIMSITSWKDYMQYEISDWLINYESGFVRRGIVGQFLLWLERIHLYDVRSIIILITIIASCFILVILSRLFKKEGWSPLILPTGMCFGYTLFSLWGRRDLISLMLTALIFFLFRYLISHPRKWGIWGLFYILSIFQILMHEGAFFYTFPILMLISFQRLNSNHKGIMKSATLSMLQFLPILLTMAIVCLKKCDINMAEAIWKSWDEVFSAFPSGTEPVKMGEGVLSLTWNAKSTFINHFLWAYFGFTNIVYWRILIILFFLLSTYYLLTRINSVNMGLYKIKAINHTLMSNVAIVQFFVMLPMFTVLSCDWGRTIPYAVISSLFFYHIFKEEQLCFPQAITSLSSKIQQLISDNRLLSTPYTYIFLVLVTPIPTWAAPFDRINTLQQFLYYDNLVRIKHILTFIL